MGINIEEDATGVVPLPGESSGLFVRKSSGLVREMTGRDATSMGLGGVNAIATIAVSFGIALTLFPGVDLTWGWIIGAVLMIPMAFAYAQLVATFPRSGGEFIYLSRIFHPIVGAMLGVGFFVATFLNLGGNAVFDGQLFTPNFFATLGSAAHVSAFTSFSQTLSHHFPECLVGAGFVVLVGAIALRGVHALGRAMFYCICAALIAEAVFLFETLTHSHGAFVAAFDHSVHNRAAYSQVIAAARKAGLHTGPHFSQVIAGMPFFAALGYWGYQTANYPAGEIKRVSRTYRIGTFVALAVGAIMLVVAWLALRHMAGLPFLQSANYLNANAPSAYAKITGGAPLLSQYYATLVAGDPVTKIVIAGGFLIGSLAFLMALMAVLSRLVFALAFDRILPTRLSVVGKRTHAPYVAIIVGGIGSVIFVILTIYSTGFVKMTRNSVLIFCLLFTISCLGAAVLAHRRPDLYGAGPKVIDRRWLGVPAITWIAALATAINAFFFYEVAAKPSLSNGYDFVSVATVCVAVSAGSVFYIISRLYLARVKGVDLALSMRELPPE